MHNAIYFSVFGVNLVATSPNKFDVLVKANGKSYVTDKQFISEDRWSMIGVVVDPKLLTIYSSVYGEILSARLVSCFQVILFVYNK